MFVAMRSGASTRDDAEARYLDAMQLLAVPPVPVATLEADLAKAKEELAAVEGSAALSSIDPSSDEATATLVWSAQNAGLSVLAVARLRHAQTQVNSLTYDVDAVRMTVHGASQDAVIAFLQGLNAIDPALVPSLTSLTVEDGGVTAEIVISAYAKQEPTPVAGAREAE
jgi:hypothetical protein